MAHIYAFRVVKKVERSNTTRRIQWRQDPLQTEGTQVHYLHFAVGITDTPSISLANTDKGSWFLPAWERALFPQSRRFDELPACSGRESRVSQVSSQGGGKSASSDVGSNQLPYYINYRRSSYHYFVKCNKEYIFKGSVGEVS